MIELSKKFDVLHGHIIEGKGIKPLARENGLSKTTVKKYIREYKAQKSTIITGGDKSQLLLAMSEAPKYKTRKPMAKRAVTPEVEAIIKKCLADNERKKSNGQTKLCMKSIDIHRLIIESGIKISYPSVNNRVKLVQSQGLEAYIKQEYAYGEVCEFDWCEVKLTIQSRVIPFRMAVFTLAATNIRYGILYRTEDTQAFMDAHIRFFEYIGGISRCMVYDNMRVAIAKFVGKTEKVATVSLKQLSTYYGFRYRFCNIRKGNEKGHVERSVEYVRRRAFSGEWEFENEGAAQKRLSETIERLNSDKSELLELERAAMLPSVPDYSSVVRVKGIANKLSTVTYKQNHYSVPDYLVGIELEIYAYMDEIVIKHKNNEVGRHKRRYENHVYSLDIMHYRETLLRKPGALNGSLCLKQSCDKLREIHDIYFRDNPKEFILTLDLLNRYSVSQLNTAINILVQTGAAVQLDSIKMILGNKVYVYKSDENNEIEQACEAQLRRYAEKSKISGGNSL